MNKTKLRGKTVPKHSLESMAFYAGTRGHTFWMFCSPWLGFLHLTVVSTSVLVVLLPVGRAVLVMYTVAVSRERGSVSNGRGPVGQDSTGLAFPSRLFGTLG